MCHLRWAQTIVSSWPEPGYSQTAQIATQAEIRRMSRFWRTRHLGLVGLECSRADPAWLRFLRIGTAVRQERGHGRSVTILLALAWSLRVRSAAYPMVSSATCRRIAHS